ncbi:hypothetical protein [Desulfobacula sp.]
MNQTDRQKQVPDSFGIPVSTYQSKQCCGVMIYPVAFSFL